MKKTLLFSILFFTFSFFTFGQTVTKPFVTATTPKTFTVPPGVVSVIVECWGAGGAGGGSTNAVGATARTGAGGGGGAYTRSSISVSPTNILEATVGDGGTGVSGNTGNSGGGSTIKINGASASSQIYAAGGSGGTGNTSGGNPAGGQGGTTGNVGGLQIIAGNNGGAGESNYGAESGSGGNGAGTTGGAGGAAIGSAGNSANGNAGTVYGGGGSGSRTSQTAGNRTGGAGAAGKVVITYDCPTSAGTLSGNQYLCTYNPATTTFASTVPGGTWSSSSGSIVVNSTTGVISVAAGVNTSATITYTIPSTTDCPTARTATRIVYATNTQPTGPNAPTGTTPVCQGTSATYTTNSIANVTYNWVYTGTGGTVVANGNSATVTFSATATDGRVEVSTTNGCGTSGAAGINVFVSKTSNGGTLVAQQTPSGCAGQSYITRLELSGQIGSVVRWESSTDNFVSNITTINTTATGMNIGNLSQTTSYRVVVQNSPCTTTATSTPVTVTIGSTSYTVTSASSSTPADVCINTAIPTITHNTTGATGIGTPNNLPAGVTASYASNVITITGTPTAAGTFNYSIPLSGGCGAAANATGTITVRQNTVSASSTTNTCVGVLMTSITRTTTGATGIGAPSGLPPGVNASWSSNTLTISGTPTTANSYTYSIPLTGGCGTVNATGTINVNSNNAITLSSTSGTNAQTVCIGTPITSITYSLSGTTTYTITGLPSGVSSSVTGTTLTISGTPTAVNASPYTYNISLTGGCGTASASGTIRVNPNNTITLSSASGTNGQTVCVNNPITPIVYSLNGTTTYNITGLPNGVTHSISGNTLTISGTPDTPSATPYSYNIALTGGCGTISTTGTIRVNPVNSITLTSGTNTNAQTVCISTPITAITYSLTGTTTYTITGLPSGVSSSVTGTTLTISGTPNAVNASPYTYNISLTGGCGTVSASGTIRVNPALAASVTITHDQPSLTICQGTHVRFTANPTNPGSNPSYQWYNGTTILTGNTGISYLHYNLKSTDDIKVVMTSNATPCLTGSPATSNSFAFTVITTDRGRTQGGQPICSGTIPNKVTLVNAENPGQNAAYSYSQKVIRWEYSDDNNATWTPIPGTATLIEYQPTDPIYAKRAFRAVAQTSGCPIVEAAIETTFDIKPLPTPTFTSTVNANYCVGTDVTYTTQAGFFAYAWTVPGTLNSDYTVIGGGLGTTSNTVTLRWLSAGSKTVTVNYKNSYNGDNNAGCYGAAAASANTNISDSFVAPNIGTIVQPTCTVATGSITITGLPNSGTLLQEGSNNAPNATHTFTGNSITISGLVAGDYRFAIDSFCSTNYTSIITINASNKWNGTSWSNGGDPTADDILQFDADYTENKDINGCSCTVANGAKVTVASGRTMTITNFVHVDNGTLTFENNASLVQKNNLAVNTGFIIYKRNTTPVRRYDFTRWSVPVDNPAYTMHDLSPNTLADKYYYYHPVDGWKINGNGTLPMEVGRGYSIRAPQTYAITGSGQVYNAEFTGVPNNGTIPYTVTTGLWNMIGNPYPSALSAKEFVERNSVAGTDVGALYFWTHKSLPSDAVDGDAKYNYTSDDYAVWTLTGGVVTQSGAATPSGYIAAAQGFFINPVGNQITFNNEMRIGGNNTQFFKTKETAEQNRVWLNFTNTQGAFKQILLGYIEGATNSIDTNYDAETMSSNSYIDFYTISDALKLTIQARAVPFDETEVVTLGYKTTIAGDFTIAIDHADGLFDNQKIYLEDKTTGIITDLQTSNYTFTTKIGTFTDRFKLRYTSKTLGTDDFENLGDSVLLSVNNKAVKVSSSKENIKDISIYNVGGQEIFSKKKVAENELLISNLQASPQVLLVKITLENDYTITKKIVFH